MSVFIYYLEGVSHNKYVLGIIVELSYQAGVSQYRQSTLCSVLRQYSRQQHTTCSWTRAKVHPWRRWASILGPCDALSPRDPPRDLGASRSDEYKQVLGMSAVLSYREEVSQYKKVLGRNECCFILFPKSTSVQVGNRNECCSIL